MLSLFLSLFFVRTVLPRDADGHHILQFIVYYVDYIFQCTSLGAPICVTTNRLKNHEMSSRGVLQGLGRKGAPLRCHESLRLQRDPTVGKADTTNEGALGGLLLLASLSPGLAWWESGI